MDLDFSYNKSKRLLNKSDFQNLRSGSRFFVSDVLIFYSKKNELAFNRLGIAVSKKYGNAVKRNKVKRLIREKFRHQQRNLSGEDILVGMNIKKIKKVNLSHEEVVGRVASSMDKAYKEHLEK